MENSCITIRNVSVKTVWGPTFPSLNVCPRGHVSESLATSWQQIRYSPAGKSYVAFTVLHNYSIRSKNIIRTLDIYERTHGAITLSPSIVNRWLTMVLVFRKLIKAVSSTCPAKDRASFSQISPGLMMHRSINRQKYPLRDIAEYIKVFWICITLAHELPRPIRNSV